MALIIVPADPNELDEEKILEELETWSTHQLKALVLKMFAQTKLDFSMVAAAHAMHLENEQERNKTLIADLTASLMMYRDPVLCGKRDIDKQRLDEMATKAIKQTGLFNQ